MGFQPVRPSLRSPRQGTRRMWFRALGSGPGPLTADPVPQGSASALDASVRVPHVRARDHAQGPLLACPRTGARIALPGAVGRAGRSLPTPWAPCVAVTLLLYPQSPVLLASLGVGLLTLLGLAVGSYLVRRSRRPRITLVDPSEKYLLRLLDKTVSWRKEPGRRRGPELPSCYEGDRITVVAVPQGTWQRQTCLVKRLCHPPSRM